LPTKQPAAVVQPINISALQRCPTNAKILQDWRWLDIIGQDSRADLDSILAAKGQWSSLAPYRALSIEQI
jgi:hypothetical protein